MNQPEPYFRLKAAAETISARENGSPQTVYRWLLAEIKAGQIPSYFIGKRRFIKLSDVVQTIEQSRK